MNDNGDLRENDLLAALSDDSLQRLLPSLDPVVLPPGEILYNFGDELTHIYFPNRNTVVSFLCTTDDGIDVEVGLCGNEGAVGFNGLLGAQTTSLQNLVQVPGTGTRLEISAARKEFGLCGSFQDMVLRFAYSMFVQVSQTALCNRVHSDEERLARWLLLSDDRVKFRQLPLPRQLLAKLLGRNVSGASLTAGLLQQAGLITYNGAELVIVDRERLESVACSCYWVVRRQTCSVQEISNLKR